MITQPIEMWRVLSVEGIRLLTNLFNVIWDIIPQDIIWDSLKARSISQRYIEAIWDMYDRVSLTFKHRWVQQSLFQLSRPRSGINTKPFYLYGHYEINF